MILTHKRIIAKQKIKNYKCNYHKYYLYFYLFQVQKENEAIKNTLE